MEGAECGATEDRAQHVRDALVHGRMVTDGGGTAAHNGDAPRAGGGAGGCPVGRGAHHGDDFTLDDAGGSPE